MGTKSEYCACLEPDLKVDVDVAGIAAVPVGKVKRIRGERSATLSRRHRVFACPAPPGCESVVHQAAAVEDLKKGLEEGFG